MNDPAARSLVETSLGRLEIKDLGHVIAVGLIVLYFCGFLVVNAYNGRLGIRDYDALRTQYVVAGLIEFALIAMCAAVGRWNPSRSGEEMREYAKQLRANGRGTFSSSAIAIFTSLTDQVFRICH